jgi:hypothetical protein
MADLSGPVRVGACRMGESFVSDFRTCWREVRDLATESREEDLTAAVYCGEGWVWLVEVDFLEDMVVRAGANRSKVG